MGLEFVPQFACELVQFFVAYPSHCTPLMRAMA